MIQEMEQEIEMRKAALRAAKLTRRLQKSKPFGQTKFAQGLYRATATVLSPFARAHNAVAKKIGVPQAEPEVIKPDLSQMVAEAQKIATMIASDPNVNESLRSILSDELAKAEPTPA
jgi:hypothetical protein